MSVYSHRVFTRMMLVAFVSIAARVPAASPVAQPVRHVLRLDSLAAFEFDNVDAAFVTYRQRHALRLLPHIGAVTDGWQGYAESVAIIRNSEFHNGIIDAEVSGAPMVGAREGSRGFVGIAFRTQPHASAFETFYLRPTNGRADDQLRRNHAVQYQAFPDFQWDRLRQQSPGVYETYADIEPGAWTTMKIVVSGTTARLYVNGASQPTLVVNDLKLGDAHGSIALWIGQDTEAYFSRLSVTPAL